MDSTECKIYATEMRKDIISMIAAAKSGHPGGSLSCIDILSAMYFAPVLTYDAKNPSWDARDYFILAKGHAAPALYATLAYAGFFEKEELKTLRKLGSRLQGHPDPNLVPGVEVSTGSLGQGLSVACGIACGLKVANKQNKVFTILGDGECQEGQVWEAAMFAAHENLGNLVAIIDNNTLQIDGRIDDVCSPHDLNEKFSAFGWSVSHVDGHNMDELIDVLTKCKNSSAQAPQCIIAHTTKGKGVSFMEDEAGWHGKAPSEEEANTALKELDAALEELRACKGGVCHD